MSWPRFSPGRPSPAHSVQPQAYPRMEGCCDLTRPDHTPPTHFGRPVRRFHNLAMTLDPGGAPVGDPLVAASPPNPCRLRSCRCLPSRRLGRPPPFVIRLGGGAYGPRTRFHSPVQSSANPWPFDRRLGRTKWYQESLPAALGPLPPWWWQSTRSYCFQIFRCTSTTKVRFGHAQRSGLNRWP